MFSNVYFNPRFPRGKRLCGNELERGGVRISIHASRGGSDQAQPEGVGVPKIFQSTLPAGEATQRSWRHCPAPQFQSTLPAGEATWQMMRRNSYWIFQSTLPAGEATAQFMGDNTGLGISIHASRGGSDNFALQDPESIVLFQSTLPAGEATSSYKKSYIFHDNFNPRFPRGKRLRPFSHLIPQFQFQSTLPAGEATEFKEHPGQMLTFQSTLPAGEATLLSSKEAAKYIDFNPRFPRGKRQYGQAVP